MIHETWEWRGWKLKHTNTRTTVADCGFQSQNWLMNFRIICGKLPAGREPCSEEGPAAQITGGG